MERERTDGAPESVTQLLLQWREGESDAFNRLFPLVYDELRVLARRQRRRTGGDATLNTTALAHEAYLRLVDHTRLDVTDRGHFFAIAARAMRHILVDHVRARVALKRGGKVQVVSVDVEEPATVDGANIIAVDLALSKLEMVDPRLGRLVELRVFAGLSVEEAASALGVSSRTVKRDWQKARAFLAHELPAAGRS